VVRVGVAEPALDEVGQRRRLVGVLLGRLLDDGLGLGVLGLGDLEPGSLVRRPRLGRDTEWTKAAARIEVLGEREDASPCAGRKARKRASHAVREETHAKSGRTIRFVYLTPSQPMAVQSPSSSLSSSLSSVSSSARGAARARFWPSVFLSLRARRGGPRVRSEGGRRSATLAIATSRPFDAGIGQGEGPTEAGTRSCRTHSGQP
jgi:hypothetical protein